MTHWHITSWVVALILVFVSYGLYGSGKAKGAKITHMILRLFYIIIILTGAELLSVLRIGTESTPEKSCSASLPSD